MYDFKKAVLIVPSYCLKTRHCLTHLIFIVHSIKLVRMVPVIQKTTQTYYVAVMRVVSFGLSRFIPHHSMPVKLPVFTLMSVIDYSCLLSLPMYSPSKCCTLNNIHNHNKNYKKEKMLTLASKSNSIKLFKGKIAILIKIVFVMIKIIIINVKVNLLLCPLLSLSQL